MHGCRGRRGRIFHRGDVALARLLHLLEASPASPAPPLAPPKVSAAVGTFESDLQEGRNNENVHTKSNVIGCQMSSAAGETQMAVSKQFLSFHAAAILEFFARRSYFASSSFIFAMLLWPLAALAGGTPPAAKTMDIGQGLPHALNLTGPIAVDVGGPTSGPGGEEQAQGQWAAQTIEPIINRVPAVGELTRFNTKSDLSAGETLDDDTFQSQLPPTYAKSSSVVFNVPITFTATGFQVTGINYRCNGPVCVPAYSSDGDTGVYTARPEICLSSSDHTSLKEVKDEHDKTIECKTADGMQGRDGHWYDLADPWKFVAHLTGAGPPAVAWNQPQPANPVYKGTLSIPVDLPVPVNSVRIEFELGLKDSGQNAPHAASDPYIETYWGYGQSGNTFNHTGGPEAVVTRFAIQLHKITVLPAAFIQMKVLPYTILYRPPGDKSQGSFSTTVSYGTTLTTGANTAIDNSTAFMESMGIQNNLSVSALIAQVATEGSETQSTTNTSDIGSIVGTGLVTANSHTTALTQTLGPAPGGTPDSTILPAVHYVVPNTCNATNFTANGCTLAAPETYYQEPFWEDRIILLLNPSAALWNFKAGTTAQLLGGQDFASVTIRDLSGCAQNKGKAGWSLTSKVSLTPAECGDLLTLDPFYIEGQEFDPSQTNRGVLLGGGNYGVDPRGPSSAGESTAFQNIFSFSTAQATNAAASYQASVTSVVGFSWSAGMSLAAKYSAYGLNVGISDGTTVSEGYKNTTGTQMKVTYTASSVATSVTTTTITGSFNDDHDLDTPACQANSDACTPLWVNVYIDELFGSFMFSDPNAAANPLLTIIHRSPYPGPGKIPIKLPAGTK
jgi:hypothetical protein